MNGPREEQAAALQVTRFDHIVINCRDVDITAAWYERVLGMSRETFGPTGRTSSPVPHPPRYARISRHAESGSSRAR
ncbi:glyoxalase [Mycobacteroides abscessus subsp. abscessus]|nr:glyoxalase [Mycobacteroides abscessus subsp. abscessus]